MTSLRELCLGWVYEMYEEQKQLALSRTNSSNTVTVYKRAHSELSKYPNAISSVRELVVVKGIGPGIIKTLELKLAKHLKDGHVVPGLAPVDIAATAQIRRPAKPRDRAIHDELELGNSTAQPPQKRQRKMAEYVPKYRSGAWSILVTLKANSDSSQYLTKHEIIKKGQEHADAPLDAPINGGMYTGWSSMTTLIEKELVMKYGHPPRFTLTEEGSSLVDRMLASLKGKDVGGTASQANQTFDSDDEGDYYSSNSQPLQSSNSQSSNRPPTYPIFNVSSSSSTQPATFKPSVSNLSSYSTTSSKSTDQPEPIINNVTLPAGSYEIILILDNREIKNGSNRDFFKDGLARRGIKYEAKSLELGDVTWVARPKCDGTYYGDEYIMLEYILERKTLDDLVASIKDGRFKEQKFRLSKCGLPKIIYLLEEVNTESAESFGYDGVFTALTQTQLENGFFVKKTTSAEDTLNYLISITQCLKQLYKDKSLVFDNKKQLETKGNTVYSISYAEFQRRNMKTKNFMLGDVWIRQLMVIHGMSAEKACFFARTYKTSASFYKALSACANDTEREKLIVAASGDARKGIGAAVAKRMLNVFWRGEVLQE
ncbi:Crossover junction endonuclease mus81 [Rhizoclosmatium sp. JEL0117]|nr:Crossover junction endonuclease mus81 [Rhizoclosmatium sp. JEL0117]